MARHILLFDGNDNGLSASPWVTNGTAAGTYELTGISGAFPGAGIRQFFPMDLRVFNAQVLFNGEDAAGQFGLWLTKGTAVSTRELTGISGASTSGINPFGFTVFGNEVLFNGQDAAGNQGFWVTNGTAAGTYELTGI